MQKIDARDEHVTRLSALFSGGGAAVVVHAEPEPVEASPDPRAVLEEERKRVLAQAREDGYEQGMRQAQSEIQDAADAVRRKAELAHAAAMAELEARTDALATLLRRLPDMVDEIQDSTASAAAELAYAALLRVLDEVPPAERMAAVCRQALREQHQRPLVLRVGSDDAVVLEGLADGHTVRTEVDARLKPGQCQLETGLGLHDTGLDVRLDLLKQAFLRGIAGANR